MAQGGDVLELRVNHPTLGSRVFFPKSGEDNNLDLGGFRNEDDANMVTASGEAIVKKNFVVILQQVQNKVIGHLVWLMVLFMVQKVILLVILLQT